MSKKYKFTASTKSLQITLDKLNTSRNELAHSRKRLNCLESFLFRDPEEDHNSGVFYFPHQQCDIKEFKCINYERIKLHYQDFFFDKTFTKHTFSENFFHRLLEDSSFVLESSQDWVKKIESFITEISENKSKRVNKLITSLNYNLYLYRETDNKFYIIRSIFLIETFKKEFWIKWIDKFINYINDELFTLLKRDIRQIFRSIVRFLFKNLDDEDSNRFFTTVINSILFTSKKTVLTWTRIPYLKNLKVY